MTDNEFVDYVKELLNSFFEDAGEDTDTLTNDDYYNLLRELIH